MKEKTQHSSTYLFEDKVILNGKIYPKPKGRGWRVVLINDMVFVNRREIKNGEWRLTLRSLWYSLFN